MVAHILKSTGLVLLSMTSLFMAALAQDDYQLVSLITTSNNASYNNRPLSNLNYNLEVIFMIGYGPSVESFGWSDTRSELAYHVRVFNNETRSWGNTWVPLMMATEWQGYTGVQSKPTTGSGAPFFPDPGRRYDTGNAGANTRNQWLILQGVQDWWLKANLVLSEDGRLGMDNGNGWESKWFACDGGGWGSGVHWIYGETMPGPYAERCVSLEIWKVAKPAPTPVPSAVFPGVSSTASHRFYQPTPAPAHAVGAAKRTTNAGARAGYGSTLILFAGCAAAALGL